MALKQKRRHQEWVHIRRKMRILKDIWNEDIEDWTGHDQPHRLSKMKIHCSCPCCSPKTNRPYKGHGGWKPSDQRKLAKGWADGADL